MQLLLIMFVCSGLLLAGLSIPMILGRIAPNGLYGFRVKKTLERPEIWYPVNRYSGKWLLATGLCLVVASVILAQFPSIALEWYSLGVLVVFVLLLTITVIASVRYMNSL
jgi:uncharacterized membrane protein